MEVTNFVTTIRKACKLLRLSTSFLHKFFPIIGIDLHLSLNLFLGISSQQNLTGSRNFSNILVYYVWLIMLPWVSSFFLESWNLSFSLSWLALSAVLSLPVYEPCRWVYQKWMRTELDIWNFHTLTLHPLQPFSCFSFHQTFHTDWYYFQPPTAAQQ